MKQLLLTFSNQAFSAKLLALVCPLLLAMCSYFGITRTASPHFELFYFLGLLAACTCAGLFGDRNDGLDVPNPYRKAQWLLGLALFGLALALRAHDLTSESVWLDEETQAYFTLKGRANSLVDGAAKQQQPPLGYFFSAITLSLFGFTELGARASSLLLGALAIPLFHSFLISITRSQLWSFLGGLLLATNGWLIRYAQEGRPVAAGIFFEILYFAAAWDYIRRPNLRRFWALVAAGLLFFLSLGLQPVLIVGTCCLAALPYLGVVRARKISAGLCAAGIASLALFLPIQLLMLGHSTTFLAANGWSRLKESALAAAPLQFTRDFLAQLGPHAGLVAALIGFASLAVVVWWFVRPKSAKIPLPARWALVPGLAVACAIFPTLFMFVFNSFVSWWLMPRYHVTYIPLVTLCFCLALAAVGAALKHLPLAIRVCAFGVFLILVAPQVNDYARFTRYAYHFLDRTNPGWRELYSYLRKHGKSGDAAYLLALAPARTWRPAGFLSTRFYDTGTLRLDSFQELDNQKITSVADLIAADLKNSSRDRPSALHLVFLFNFAPDTDDSKNVRNSNLDALATSTGQFKQLYVVSLPVKQSLGRTLKTAVGRLASSMPATEANHLLQEILLVIALHENNHSEARYRLAELRRMNASGDLTALIEKYSAQRFEGATRNGP